MIQYISIEYLFHYQNIHTSINKFDYFNISNENLKYNNQYSQINYKFNKLSHILIRFNIKDILFKYLCIAVKSHYHNIQYYKYN